VYYFVQFWNPRHVFAFPRFIYRDENFAPLLLEQFDINRHSTRHRKTRYMYTRDVLQERSNSSSLKVLENLLCLFLTITMSFTQYLTFSCVNHVHALII